MLRMSILYKVSYSSLHFTGALTLAAGREMLQGLLYERLDDSTTM